MIVIHHDHTRFEGLAFTVARRDTGPQQKITFYFDLKINFIQIIK